MNIKRYWHTQEGDRVIAIVQTNKTVFKYNWSVVTYNAISKLLDNLGFSDMGPLEDKK